MSSVDDGRLVAVALEHGLEEPGHTVLSGGKGTRGEGVRPWLTDKAGMTAKKHEGDMLTLTFRPYKTLLSKTTHTHTHTHIYSCR